MVTLDPVRAWLPNRSVADPDTLVCPVYDTLTAADFARYASYPYNAARFVPRPAELPLSSFLERASTALAGALGAEAFVRDERPGLYIYGIRYVPPPDILEALEPGDRRPEYLLLGLVGRLDLGRLEHGQVALHERTFTDRVAERVALTDATRTSFAPILAGYHGKDHRLNDRLETILGIRRSHLSFAGSVAPAASASLAGTTHLIWRVDDPSLVAELREAVRTFRLLILDGHHRFTAAAQRQHSGRPTAALVMLVDGGDRALQLLPWHRVLSASVAPPEHLLERARNQFPAVIDRGAATGPDEAVTRLHAMRREHVRGFLMVSHGRLFEVQGSPSDDAGWDFDLLHEFLDDALGIDPEVLQFVRSPRAALEVAGGRAGESAGGTAFLLPGLSARGVEERAFERGEVMAQKSTMFLPKVAEGMIFAPADPD